MPVLAQEASNFVDQFWAHYNAGQYSEAERAASAMLRINQQNRHAIGVGLALFMLGKANEKLERYDQAEQYYRETIRHIPEEGDAAVLTQTHYQLAWLLKNQTRYDESEKFYRSYMARIEAAEGADSPQLIAPLAELAESCIRLKQYPSAEEMLTRARKLAEQENPPNAYRLAAVSRNLGFLRQRQTKYDEAERFYRESLRKYERIEAGEAVAVLLEDLALLLCETGRYREAEEFALRALARRMQQFGASHSFFANSQNTLARIYAGQGRLAEAEMLFKQALDTRVGTLGPKHGKVAASLVDLAGVCIDQERYEDAAALLYQSLEIDENVWGADHENLVPNLSALGAVLLQLDRLNEAEQVYQRQLNIVGPNASNAGPCYASLGQLYLNRQEFDRAKQAYRRAIELNDQYVRETGFHFNRTVAPALRGLARLYNATGEYEQSGRLYDQAIDRLEQHAGEPSELIRAYWGRANNSWAQAQHAAAAEDFARAMELAEQKRTNLSGTDVERSMSFTNMTVVFEDMARMQTEIGGVDVALNAIERGRNRSLLDQLATQGIDLLDGIPDAQRAELERRLAAAASRMAAIEQQLDDLQSDTAVHADDRKRRSEPLHKALAGARHEYVVVQADIRDASPAYRLAVSASHQPVSLTELQQYVAEHDALLLRFMVGDQASLVLAVTTEGASRLVELQVDVAQAEALGIAPGPLDERKLAVALRNSQQTGVLQQLRNANRPQVERELAPKLTALWQILIPRSEQAALTSGSVKRLIVVPDGDLAMLPFEALMVGAGGTPQYLLDAGPPIAYAPSATILCNLAQRPALQKDIGSSGLTVGDPSYNAASSAGGGRAADGSTHRAVVERLSRLPHSGLESSWVEQLLAKSGMSVTRLVGSSATEGNIRQNLRGRQFLHFACHGLVDPSYGNLFGALAVARGDAFAANSRDDGFLTLDEIYQLDLRGSELTILSACDTNVGPGQIGEGVWALSRGFLVAGTRRVVASNWVVDDAAGASTVSYFIGHLAKASADNSSRDYAASLHAAKQFIRRDPRWSSPFYWSSLVLVGPN